MKTHESNLRRELESNAVPQPEGLAYELNASEPATISKISVVMDAWRALL